LKREVQIASDLSTPTDLAQLLGKWSEFQSGACHQVDLFNAYTGEQVQVRHMSAEHAHGYVLITSEHPGNLFKAVLGEIVYSLSQQSDNLLVDRSTIVT
jgi:hypothetical protein